MKLTQDFDLLHDVSPGRHFYQFYRFPEDLLKVLNPYWQTGVRKGNFCFWVVPAFMTLEEAVESLSASIPHIETLINSKKFEMVTHEEWYGNGENLNIRGMVQKYTAKIKSAIENGFSCVRMAGDASGFRKSAWPLLQDYEKVGQSQIHSMPCIALCSYPLHELSLHQTKQVLDHHHSVLVAKV